MRILILCTGNSCRSQMAQGFLESFSNDTEVCSAGINPSGNVNQRAIKVMKEKGIDISGHYPKPVDLYIDDEWDYVITVCDNARITCPVFPGKVKKQLHFGFDDPTEFTGTEAHITNEFRRIRDEIEFTFYRFYNDFLK